MYEVADASALLEPAMKQSLSKYSSQLIAKQMAFSYYLHFPT